MQGVIQHESFQNKASRQHPEDALAQGSADRGEYCDTEIPGSIVPVLVDETEKIPSGRQIQDYPPPILVPDNLGQEVHVDSSRPEGEPESPRSAASTPKQRRWSYAALVCLIAAILTASLVVGIVCGTGHCKASESDDESAEAVTGNTVTQHGWEHSLASSDYQMHYDGWVVQGYRLVYVSGFEDEGGMIRYNTIWHKNTNDINWNSSHEMTETQYEEDLKDQSSRGFRPVFVDGFSVTDSLGFLSPRINAVYHKQAEPQKWHARQGQTSSEYQDLFDEEQRLGYALDVVSTYQQDGSIRHASIFSRHKKAKVQVSPHGMTLSQANSTFWDYFSQGYSLDYLSAGTVQGSEPRFAAIYVKEQDQFSDETLATPPFVAKINIVDLLAETNEWTVQDYMPKVVDAYQTKDGSVRWGLLFERVVEDLPESHANGKTFPETTCFDDLVVDYMKRQGIPGANVAVLKDGKIVYSQGYGVRDVPGLLGDFETDRPRKVMPYTPFRIASISKSVTSFAVLRLVQEGKLALSDKVFGMGGVLQSLSDNPKSCCPIVDERIEDITVKHLLTHTGGWTDKNYDPLYHRSKEVASKLGIQGPPNRDDYIYFMFGQPLKHEPGTTYEYSNFDFNMLARIIEQVTGNDYEQAVRELALDVAGVCQEEMYTGSTQLKDVGRHEPEYHCPACPMIDSIFPSEPNKVPFQYGGQHLEAFPASSGWVASAQQVMVMFSAVAQPHCNGTIPEQNTDICLLWESFVSELDESKPAFCGPGDGPWHFDEKTPPSTWYQSGGLAGSGTLIVRTDEYSFAFVTNDGGYTESEDVVMAKAIKCVKDWPSAFEIQSLCS